MEELEETDATDGFADDGDPAGKKRGRKRLGVEKKINANIYAIQKDIDYLLTWNEGSPTLAFAELIGILRKLHPRGRFSAPNIDPAARNAPGTKTDLKKQIKERDKVLQKLQAQLRRLGVEPEASLQPPAAKE